MKKLSHPRFVVAVGALSLMLTSTVFAADKPKTEKEKLSYAVGFQIGGGVKQNIQQNGIEVDNKVLLQAIADALNGETPALSMDEMRTVLENEQKKAIAKFQKQAEEAKAAGQKFLAENSKKEGVVTRESGLQYKVISTGKGKQAKATGSITAHYEGKLINGNVFDSSYRRGEPATFGVNQVIPGWQEVLPLMREGDKWQVFIPSDLAYGERGQGPIIGPNETLIFDIELIKVN